LEDRLCPSGSYLVVGSFDNNSVFRYDERSGAFVDQIDPQNLGSLKTPSAGIFGTDGNLYVSSNIFEKSNQRVLQYNGATGAFQTAFASQNVTSPRAVLFGPDGDLYVADGNDEASGDPASVERFDGKTGAFLNYFVAQGSGGLEHPSYMVFGPDGRKDGKLDLYVAAAHEGAIYRYDGSTGAFKGVFVSAVSGGLDAPQGMVFGPDGNLYVASGNWFTSSNGPFYTGEFPPGAVLSYEGPSGHHPGRFRGTFVPSGSGGLANPSGMLFGPDPSGSGKIDLYVATSFLKDFKAETGTSEVLRYDGTTGAFLGTFVSPDSGGLRFPTFLTFTETDPTTLNYDGTLAPAILRASLTLAGSKTVQSSNAIQAVAAAGNLLSRSTTVGSPVVITQATNLLDLAFSKSSIFASSSQAPAASHIWDELMAAAHATADQYWLNFGYADELGILTSN
jgi:DNA-binding beta-propeller fold protein YncE